MSEDLGKLLKDNLMAMGMVDGVKVEVMGQVVELRSPTLKERGQMITSAQKGSETDTSRLQALAIIHMVRNAETGKAVFELADLDHLESVQSGSPLDKLGLRALQMLNFEADTDEVKNV